MIRYANPDHSIALEVEIDDTLQGRIVVTEGNLDAEISHYSRYGQDASPKVTWPSLGAQSPECAAAFAQVIQVAAEVSAAIVANPSVVKFLAAGKPVTIPSTSTHRDNGAIVFRS